MPPAPPDAHVMPVARCLVAEKKTKQPLPMTFPSCAFHYLRRNYSLSSQVAVLSVNTCSPASALWTRRHTACHSQTGLALGARRVVARWCGKQLVRVILAGCISLHFYSARPALHCSAVTPRRRREAMRTSGAARVHDVCVQQGRTNIRSTA